MNEFWKTHFDKVLLSALFLIALGTFMHFARAVEFYTTNSNAAHLSGVVNWLENTVGQILAALLTLMVGRSLTASASATPKNGATAVVGPAADPASTAPAAPIPAPPAAPGA